MARPSSSDDSLFALPSGSRMAAVVSSYHHEVTAQMLRSARETLLAAGLAPDGWLELEAPGAFELPLIAQRLARRDDVHAVLCFGLVLKGETEHDRHIAGAVCRGLLEVGLQTDTPVLFGVLTCATLEQARQRARPRAAGGLDKGHEVARAAIGALGALGLASHAFEALPAKR